MFLSRRSLLLPVDPLASIKDVDFIYDNKPVKIIANRNSPKIELPGSTVGPFREGQEYEVRLWIAQELKKAGIVRIRMDDPIDLMVLNKIQWKERVQTSQKVTSVTEDFYPKLRRYLEELNEEAIKKPEKRSDYEKAMNLSDDIARMRLKKIVSLASSSSKTQTSQILRSLTKEEKSIYNHLHTIISQWRNEILKTRRDDET
jgi:hypothetical protein